ncbi:PEGA domain-containing protein [Marinitoga hydrogenitolerans DSM 16785]|uniref:PEGA domain-containing protein n=1 Tax=Marinitoga hydrogenitolerans (strain DSM 16785 / JCM 12826 / AT1271) TaxID=1122195 RepID=A0A1M4WAC6_MARH1|nr:PEGA domain-containing protein [Marinitoga hydrogenitolerans]SHE78194.1 PEGA domain-containing protein [Marinitoga hydrogenitolerans DSM 16785]
MKTSKFSLIFFLTLTILSFSFQLTINAPKGALVYVNNQYILTMKNSQETLSLSKGNYEITISKFGYMDYKTSISLNSDKIVTAELIPIASIEFHSNLDKFYVTFGENKISIYNGEILKIPINIKQIIASTENYKPQTINLELNPFETKKIYIDFIPNGMVTFESTPTANLYINNTFVGETPYSTILSLNSTYNIKLKKDGYLTFEKNISLKNDEPIKLQYELKKGIKLYIDSSPQNALVTINGKKMGYTPNTFTVPSGSLKIILSKIGYISKELSINLDKSLEKKQLFFELYENNRIIRFQDSENLDFYLDGKYIGENVEYLELDGMPHIIEIVSKNNENIFFRYIINKDLPKEIILNPRLSTSVEVLSNKKILTYIGDKYAFAPSTILINTMQNTKTLDVYYLNSKKSTTLRKNRSQTIFLTNSDNVGAVSLFTSSSYALIYIDGKYINKGYVLGHVLNNGVHNVTFKFADGKTYNINININNFEHKVIFFSKANLVPVKIINTKSFDIYIDDIKYTASELDLRLEYGVHKISVYNGERKITERYIYLTDEGKYINLDNWY